MNDKVSLEEYLELLNKYEELRGNLIHRNNKYYVLKDDHNQLQSNWNSLKEYIKTEWNVVAKSPDGSFYDGYDTCPEEMKKDVLDKMNELEKSDNK